MWKTNLILYKIHFSWNVIDNAVLLYRTSFLGDRAGSVDTEQCCISQPCNWAADHLHLCCLWPYSLKYPARDHLVWSHFFKALCSTFSSVLCWKQEACLIQPEEFKYLKFFFRSVINWCCDTDGKSNVASVVMQTFYLQTIAVKPKVLSLI